MKSTPHSSLPDLTGASHMELFEQPGKNQVFSTLLYFTSCNPYAVADSFKISPRYYPPAHIACSACLFFSHPQEPCHKGLAHAVQPFYIGGGLLLYCLRVNLSFYRPQLLVFFSNP